MFKTIEMQKSINDRSKLISLLEIPISITKTKKKKKLYKTIKKIKEHN